MSTRRADAILRERARHLAAAPDTGNGGRRLLHLILNVGGEEYAIPAAVVERVLPLGKTGWTVAPGSPPVIAGLVNIGGAVFPLIDLAAVVSLPAQRPGPSSHAVLAGSPSWSVERSALLVSARPRLESIDMDRLETVAPGDESGPGPRHTLGIAHGMIAVLDLESILEESVASEDVAAAARPRAAVDNAAG